MIWKDRIVYLDVAHNEHGFLAIIDRVKQLTNEVTIVCGFSKNKDVEKILGLRLLGVIPEYDIDEVGK